MVKKESAVLLLIVVATVGSVFLYDHAKQQIGISQIDAESIFDAAATAGSVNVSLIVGVSAPTVHILSPGNKTYESANNILLKIIVTNETSPIDSLFYNVNNGPNESLTLLDGQSNATFDVDAGSNLVQVFANESQSGLLNVSVIRFSLNASIITTTVSTKFNASVTNFSSLDTDQIQAIPDLTFERSAFGKIEFLDLINITSDNLTDHPIDFDAYINITSSFIYVNITSFPNLHGGNATLSFYNATTQFSNPRVLRNNVLCPTTICVANWTENQTYKVNVTQFSRYELEETAGSGSSTATTTAEGAGTSPSVPRRGSVPPGEEKFEPEHGPEVPLKPTEEVPFGERFAEVTPKLILNKPVVVSITALMLLLLLLEYVGYRLHKSKK